ncbi:MAG TPA: biotin transporter BioY [Candidatus Acidoferrales bacterium]|nr:biotin transporter BioY [Candidatus Acidoferrales bacterium]
MIRTDTAVLRRGGSERLGWLARLAGSLLLANAVLVLCSKVAIPLPWTPVPLTLQTFGVLLIAVMFGPRTSSLAALVYLLEGAAGLPVFQPFGAVAAGRFFGPTAGYLLAFPAAAFLAGRLVEIVSARRDSLRALGAWLAMAAALLPGEAVILLCGWAWLASFLGGAEAARLGVLPFLAGDIAKLAAVAVLALALPAKR